MPPKRLIPKAREEDVLHMYWVLLQSLETKCGENDVLDRHLISNAYEQLRSLGHIKAYPQWERAEMIKEAQEAVKYYLDERTPQQ